MRRLLKTCALIALALATSAIAAAGIGTSQAGAQGPDCATTPLSEDCAPDLWSVDVSCLNEDGRLTTVLNNPTDDELALTLTADLIVRNVSVAAQSSTSVTITGRPDGDITMGLSGDDGNLRTAEVTVACDPVIPIGDEGVTASVSCLSGSGRIDFMVTNIEPVARTVVIQIGLIERSTYLEPGETTQIVVTGRRDGAYHALAYDPETFEFWSEDLIIDCVPEPTEPFTVAVSCLAERGRVDITVLNGGDAAWFDLDVGGVSRTVWGQTDTPKTTTITGRADGDYSVVISSGGTVVSETDITVDCVEDQTEAVVVTSSCLAGTGRIDVGILNTEPVPQTYALEVGSVFREVVVGAEDLTVSSITGRPNGINLVIVSVAGTTIHIEEPITDC